MTDRAGPVDSSSSDRRAGNLAVILSAAVLRAPVVALAPVLVTAQADLDLSGTMVALLVALPVLCFGVGSAPASALIGAIGTHRAFVVSVIGIVAGLVIRVLGGFGFALAGTLVLGLAITIANVAMPIVAQDRGGRAAQWVTTRYVVVMNACSLLATLLTAPLAMLTSWRLAVTLPYLVTTLAVAALLGLQRTRRGLTSRISTDGPPARLSPLIPVLLTMGFAGQTLAYYGITAWLPTQLRDVVGGDLVGAGLSAAVFQLTGAIGPLLVVWLLARSSVRTGFIAVGVLWIAFPLGMLLSAPLWWLWSLLAGLAQGGTFTLVLVAVAQMSGSARQARRTSAVVQGGGYAVGAVGPVLIGGLHEASGAWTAPMAAVLVAVVILTVAGVASSELAARRGAHEPEGSLEPVTSARSR